MDREFEDLLKDVLRELKDLTIVLKSTSKAAKQTATDQRQNQAFLKQNIVRLKEEIKQRKKSGQSFDELEQEIEDSTDALKGFEKSAKSAGGAFTSLPKKFIQGMGKLITNVAKTALMFADVSRPVDNLSMVAEQLAEGMGKAQDVATRLANDFDTVRGSFVNLAKTGAQFNGDLFRLSQAAADANIPLPKLTAFLTENASTFGNFFGLVQVGANEFINLSRGLKQITQNELAQFGLTTDETAEFLATFLEQERRRGNLQTFTAQQLTENTVHYTKTLAKLSALTGKSVDVLDEQNKAAMGDALFRASMANMDPKAANVLSAAFADAGPGVQTLIKDIKNFDNAVSPISRQLAVAAPELVQATRDLINNQGDDDAIRRFQNALGAAGERLTSEQGKGFLSAAVATGEFADVFTELVPRIRAQVGEEGLAKVLEQLATSGQEAVNVLSQFDTASAKAQNLEIQATLPATLAAATTLGETLDRLSVDDGPFDRFTDAINKATESIKNLISTLNPIKAAEKVIDKVTDAGGKAITGSANYLKENTNIEENIKAFEKFLYPKGPDKGLFGLGGGDYSGGIADYGDGLEFQRGSMGFQNFGSGTKATLHGAEAVVPQNTTLGKIIQLLEKTSTGSTVSEAVSGDNTSDRYLAELVELNKNSQRTLNTLVTIGAMTEKNTKNMNNNVANMGGSLV